jgi:hypothetical protein
VAVEGAHRGVLLAVHVGDEAPQFLRVHAVVSFVGARAAQL